MTDNSSDTPNGVDTGVGEPSMEDILASIRRIIAEDEGTEQNHFDVDAVVDPLVIEPASESVKESIAAVTEDLVIDDEDEDILVLDQLVADAGLNAQELTSIETDELVIDQNETESFNPVSSVVSDLEERLVDDTPKDLVDNIADEDNVVFSLDDPSTSTGSRENISANILSLLEDDPVQEAVEPEDDLVEFDLDQLIEDTVESSVPVDMVTETGPEIDSESDLDIVKSLMADLTDTSFLDDPVDETESLIDQAVETTDDLVDPLTESLFVDQTEVPALSVDENQDILATEIQTTMDSEEDQDQIINDILELAIQDEEGEIVDLDEAVDLAIDDELIIPEFETTEPEEDSLLLQIAAEAEADAIDATTGVASGVGAAALATAAAISVDDTPADERVEMNLMDEDTPSTEELLNELDLALAEVTQDDNQESTELVLETEPVIETDLVVEAEADTTDLFVEPEEIEDMPRSARKDAIINEVTEEASAGAFAELSQAVEEKAVYTESGPRIGDIVQDALRPMLKEWLDENLKGIVERAVAKEVKRISSGK